MHVECVSFAVIMDLIDSASNTWCILTGAALTGAESAELQEVLEETNVRVVNLQ